MSKVLSFPKARDLSAESKLSDYIEVAKQRFDELSYLLNGDWEDSSWYYKSAKEDLTFKFYGKEMPQELDDLAKVFVTKYLFDRRLKGHFPSLSQLRSLLYGIKRLPGVGVEKLADINSDSYRAVLNSLKDNTDRTKAGIINSLNNIIQWLDNEYLLSTQVDLAKAPKTGDLPALPEKMPDRELIRTIIQAKWAVEEADDGSSRWESDLLAVYSQGFQYGMGLRIGEVLRLPADPIRWKDGEMFFLVWTEKGKAPIARYVPENWRDLFEYCIEKIQKATKVYRDRAKELEDRGRLKEVEERLNTYHQKRMNDVQKRTNELQDMLKAKAKETEIKWKLRCAIEPETEYSLKEIQAAMPEAVTPTSSTNAMILKGFKAWGIEIIERPKSKRKSYHILGQTILDYVNEQIEFRRTHMIDSELTEVLHGRKLNREQSQDKNIVDRRILREGGIARAYTMKDLGMFDGGRRPPSTISLDDALELIQLHAEGGFDSSKYIDIKSFQNVFPDLFEAVISATTKHWDGLPPGLRGTDLVYVYTKTAKDKRDVVRYSKTTGYLVEQDSIHDFIKKEFDELNLAIEKELYEDSLQELEDQRVEEGVKPKEQGVVISSQSFKVQQKVSDFLMLRAASSTRALIPEIMSYEALKYSFKGNDRIGGLFSRYDVTDDVDLIAKFQSHKGRHWQTTSLFRSGASGEVVNAWMGRSASQGNQYDHNTDKERAKKVRDAMLADNHRFLSQVSDRVRMMVEDNTSEEIILDYMEQEIQVVQHTPTGLCTRPMYLKPCNLHMKCLTGNNGKGCKHYCLDLLDEAQVAKLRGFKDNTEREIERYATALENGQAGAQMHLDAALPAYNNAKLALKGRDEILLNNPDAEGDLLPFRKTGSEPDDCLHQCGD